MVYLYICPYPISQTVLRQLAAGWIAFCIAMFVRNKLVAETTSSQVLPLAVFAGYVLGRLESHMQLTNLSELSRETNARLQSAFSLFSETIFFCLNKRSEIYRGFGQVE